MVNCLLLVTGSVAAVKTWKLRSEILKLLPPNSEVRVVLTQAAQHFLTPTLAQYPEDFDHKNLSYQNTEKPEHDDSGNNNQNNNNNHNHLLPSNLVHHGQIVFRDQDEWDSYKKRGDAVLHIELRKWADVCCVAPLDANSLAKIATGLADNLLSCIMRAWEWKSKPVVIAPAMNTAMWEHPLTRPQLEIIRGFGNSGKVMIVEPVSKVLECNDVGVGALAALEDIARAVANISTLKKEEEDNVAE